MFAFVCKVVGMGGCLCLLYFVVCVLFLLWFSFIFLVVFILFVSVWCVREHLCVCLWIGYVYPMLICNSLLDCLRNVRKGPKVVPSIQNLSKLAETFASCSIQCC